MIQPESRIKKCWDLAVLAVTVGMALVIPFAVVFESTRGPVPILLTFLSSAVFIVDILVSFNISFIYQGRVIESKSEVARRYMRSWLTIDLIAALPLGVILTLLSTPEQSAVHLIRLLPLIKLFHIGRTMQRIGGTRVNPAILRLVLLLFWILLSAHVVSCGWILLTETPAGMPNYERYTRAFYWTITTITTIGYGDITPTGLRQTLYVIFVEILGAGMYGLVIGNIANLIANIDVAKTQYKEKLDRINTFLKYRNIPASQQRRINDYYNYLWESRRGYDESSVLADLPVPLKESVLLHLNREIIEKVPIFEAAGEDLIKDIIVNMEPVVFTPGDYIVRAGEVGFDMYFISRGRVDVMSADETARYATLTAGQFFGEIALLLSMPRTATIKATEYCDLYRLNKETFDRILTRYPDFMNNIRTTADARRAEIDARAQTAKKPGQSE